jgi:hypothetical protein
MARKSRPPQKLFSVLKRLFSPSDPFEKTLKTTCSSSDHYQYCLIREEKSAYTAYRGVYRGAIFGAIGLYLGVVMLVSNFESFWLVLEIAERIGPCSSK